HIAIQAADCGGSDHPFGRAARAHDRVHACADNSGRDTGGEIAVADQANACTSGANISNQLFVAWAVEHDHDEVFDVALHSLRDIFQIVGDGSVKIDCVLAGRSDNDFFHVAVGSVEQTS